MGRFIFNQMRKQSAIEKKAFCELLRNFREKAGLRQIDLAIRLKRHQSFVSKYESNEKILNLIELREICHAMGIPLNVFIAEFEKRINES